MNSRRELARKQLIALLADESGQGTVEYVLLMSVLIVVIIAVGKSLKQKMLDLMQGPIGGSLQRNFFAAPHQFNIRIR